MGGGACIIIIEGNGVQGEAARLSSTAVASCQLVEYLSQDEDIELKEADLKPIIDFHKKTEKLLSELNTELDAINIALAKKYNREYGHGY